MDQFFERLTGIRMTLVSGAFLTASLVLFLNDCSLLLDPAWGSILISGSPLLHSALTRLIRQRRITSALLISVAMLASIFIGEIFAAGEIAFIMALGEILEDKTVARAQKGLHKLVALTPVQARRLSSKGEETVAVEDIQKGDILRILPGETVPVDGVIISGSTSLDQSVMTGESLPVDKTEGDEVFSGTLNRFGAIDIRASRLGEDSSLQKLIRMVREAENHKAPMQRIVDKWASWLVPSAMLIAVAAYFLTGDISRAVTVLVVFCPCALALATPTSIMAAIGQATKHGVIIKTGEALEIMGKVDCVAFDKTGTLTHGSLSVSDIYSCSSDFSENEVLRLAASAEALSEHPLGKAVTTSARSRSLELSPVENFRMTPGKGIRAVINGHPILCGSSQYLMENGIEIDPATERKAAALRCEGKAVILLALAGRNLGLIGLSDSLRSGAGAMVGELRKSGAEVVLLTGDHKESAAWFSRKAGISRVMSELLPEQKVENVVRMQTEGKKVCMIGDGVNDAPALKTADVGVAMATMGSDIAVEAADIALVGDDIGKIPYLKKLSNATIRTIKFNITMSMIVNFIAIILSVYGILTPVTGALVHNAGSVLIVLNAALLYDRKIK